MGFTSEVAATRSVATLCVATMEGVWHLCAHVANTMNCKVTKAGDGFSAGMVASTRMLPPPDLQEREREVGNLLANLKSISVQGGQLKISSDSSSVRLDPAQE